jgi:hypothetical protein
VQDLKEDFVLPTPWRVEVDFHVPPTTFKSAGATGAPTEIRVPRSGTTTASIAPQFFQQGTRFIDEVSGRVFRVASRRVAVEPSLEVAYLTLDREVFIDDLDFTSAGGVPDGIVQREEQVRTVWVFPPAVDRSVDPPSFDGPSPVVSIDVRTMTLSPSS